ncbi:MAG: hypothetical protein ABEJ96_07465 [Thiohalorhabdaceae bacterium]
MGIVQEGIVRENAQMVARGAGMIADHPAPNHKPWAIMKETEQQDFKQSLVAYDRILHKRASRIQETAPAGNWPKASQASQALTGACIACHDQRKERVRAGAY